MNVPTVSNATCNPSRLTTNLCLHTYITLTPPKKLSTLENVISLMAWPALTPIFQSIFDATSFPRRQPHLIFSGHPALTRDFLPKPSSTASTISIAHLFYHPALKSLFIKLRSFTAPGPVTALKTGTFAQPPITIAATASTYRTRPPSALPRLSILSPQLRHAPNYLPRQRPTRCLRLDRHPDQPVACRTLRHAWPRLAMRHPPTCHNFRLRRQSSVCSIRATRLTIPTRTISEGALCNTSQVHRQNIQ